MKMKALLKEAGCVRLCDVARVGVRHDDDVEIRVVRAGICRTDLYVAKGLRPSADPVVLGHEFAGVVAAVGDAVRHVAPGDRVTASPFVGCGTCATCTRDDAAPNAMFHLCPRAQMIGVERHGAFAEFVTLPAALVYRLPPTLPFEFGAYVEPVAASLAVTNALEDPHARGLLAGTGRIAELTRRVLEACGFTNLTLCPDPSARSGSADGDARDGELFDFAVETYASAATLAALVRAVRPRGTLVLKSRPAAAVPLDVREVVHRELRLVGAHYGSFDAAIDLLADGHLATEDLFGPVHSPADFEAVFAALHDDESRKHFFGFGD